MRPVRPGWLLPFWACAKSSACFKIVTVVSALLYSSSSKSAHPFASIARSLDLSLVFLEVLTALLFVGNDLEGNYLDSFVFFPYYLWQRSWRPLTGAKVCGYSCSKDGSLGYFSLVCCFVIRLLLGFFGISIELMIPEPLWLFTASDSSFYWFLLYFS